MNIFEKQPKTCGHRWEDEHGPHKCGLPPKHDEDFHLGLDGFISIPSLIEPDPEFGSA